MGAISPWVIVRLDRTIQKIFLDSLYES